MGNAQGIEGGVFMSTGRDGSFTCADRRDARNQQTDPRAPPASPEGTLRNTSGEEQQKISSPEPQGTRLASGTYTESAVEAAEVRGDARALGRLTLAFVASDCAHLQRACPCPGERGATCD